MELRDDVRAFLAEKHFGVLATVNSDGSPQQSVMWYEPRGDTIMLNTLRGRKKDRNLQSDPRASVCVEDEYRYVTMEGTITIVDDPAITQADIAVLARRYHGPEEGDRMARDVFGKQERISLVLTIERIDVHGFDGEE